MVMPVMPRAGEWTVDDLLDLPDVLELEQDGYVERARVFGDDAASIGAPFGVTLSPGALT